MVTFMLISKLFSNSWIKKFIFMSIIAASVFLFYPSDTYAQLTQDTTRFLGNTFNDNTVPKRFDQYWNQITPGNAGKWGSVAYSQDTSTWNWSTLDFIYNYAVSHGYPFKYHNLVWGQQQPSWITSLDSAQQRQMVETWIKLAGARYPKTAMVDVVNEPLHTPPPYKNAIGGDGKTGWDWVIWTFQKAREYFPNAKLLLNDYNILYSTSNTQKYIAIIDTLKARNLIDGIGCQGHSLENVATRTIKANLDLLAATGLPIYISEYEVNLADDNVQLSVYQRQFPLFWTYPDIKGITLWGYIEFQMWSAKPNAYLLTDRLVERPAMVWLRQYLADYLKTAVVSPVDTTGTLQNPVLTWRTSTGSSQYHVQVATDSAFSSVVPDSTAADTLLQIPALAPNTAYYWRVRALNSAEPGAYTAAAAFTTGNQILAVKKSGEIPGKYALMQNYPNPFNPTTMIGYRLASSSKVVLKVYDDLGMEVKHLLTACKAPVFTRCVSTVRT